MTEQRDTPDSTLPDSTLPDTAMATGNDEGEPGHPDSRPLAKEERKLLKALQKPGKGEAEPAVEDSPEVAAAAADDAPLPLGEDVAGGNADGLDAEFTDR
ncbi:hypothetical protein O2W14_07425 [Modestobacter sp. VKM Ac-2986]|uniref:hypothetical protein n=1 Tax=Modestobacter sp. VKM Ac-2986 TaxID=3004140 RepID=UPI0022AA3CF6|nr:hypothetical protein [Modestobacter sp. VKM Ac-2986]MCZ2828656.1 hypothetical protein [Modestobacter sp. VKM Ac-2986]